MSGRRTYTLTQVADRLEAVFGQRPALSTLRSAQFEETRVTAPKPPIRITAGMPRPAETAPELRYWATEIEAWLRNHPRKINEAAIDKFRRAAVRNRPAAVASARAEGVSWAQVAQVLGELDGRSYSRQAMSQRYGGEG